MSSVNKVIIVGNLGQNPDVRQAQDGKEIANLSIATSESWKDKSTGERKTKTEWHRIVMFNEGLIKIAKQYLKKGSKIYIEGSLQTRKWTDDNGIERYVTEVILSAFNSSLVMLYSKEGGGGIPPHNGEGIPEYQSKNSNNNYSSSDDYKNKGAW